MELEGIQHIKTSNVKFHLLIEVFKVILTLRININRLRIFIEINKRFRLLFILLKVNTVINLK